MAKLEVVFDSSLIAQRFAGRVVRIDARYLAERMHSSPSSFFTTLARVGHAGGRTPKYRKRYRYGQ